MTPEQHVLELHRAIGRRLITAGWEGRVDGTFTHPSHPGYHGWRAAVRQQLADEREAAKVEREQKRAGE